MIKRTIVDILDKAAADYEEARANLSVTAEELGRKRSQLEDCLDRIYEETTGHKREGVDVVVKRLYGRSRRGA